MPTPPTAPSLLTIPPELRLKIFSHLFTYQTLKLEVQSNDSDDESTPPLRIADQNLSSQLLACNKQLYTEASTLLYSSNLFDCSYSRSSFHVLTSTVTLSNSSLIQYLALDWDYLLDFSFQLAKPHSRELTSSLIELSLAHWRTRVLGGSGFLWRDVKASERSICQAASAIIQKSNKLRLVTQKSWIKPKRQASIQVYFDPDKTRAAIGQSDPPPILPVNSANTVAQTAASNENVLPISNSNSAHPQDQQWTIRVKWRFLANESQMEPDETIVDVEKELAELTKGGVAKDEGSVQMALDPA